MQTTNNKNTAGTHACAGVACRCQCITILTALAHGLIITRGKQLVMTTLMAVANDPSPAVIDTSHVLELLQVP